MKVKELRILLDTFGEVDIWKVPDNAEVVSQWPNSTGTITYPSAVCEYDKEKNELIIKHIV